MSIRSRERHREKFADAQQSMTELDIAKAIRAGELSSPQQYENLWLFDVRVTGTGTSYRTSLDEYVYRPPDNFLTEEFVERCNGLPLIFEHPEANMLNTDEYRNRAIGSVILPYIDAEKGEVRGIAKVFDADAAQLMLTSHASTSPAVVFRDAGSTETITLNDGETVLVEGKPSLLDHLAICKEGVWDKGGEPTGVKIQEDSTVDNEEKVPAWADALTKRFDDVCSRMDAIENKGGDTFGDAEKKDEAKDEKKDEAKKDAEDFVEKKAKADDADEMADAKKDSDDEKKEGKVDAKKDEDKDEKKDAKDADERADAQSRENKDLRARIAAMDARLGAMTRPLSASDRDALSIAQARADGVAQMFGDSVNPPLHGEDPISYRKRLAAKFQKHSPEFKAVRMDSLDGPTFDLVEGRIYADAVTFANSPAQMVPGRLQAHVRADSAGRQITTYTGDMDGWMSAFKSPGYTATINRNHGKGAN